MRRILEVCDDQIEFMSVDVGIDCKSAARKGDLLRSGVEQSDLILHVQISSPNPNFCKPLQRLDRQHRFRRVIVDRQWRLLEPDRLDASGNIVKGTEVERRAGEFERFGGGFRGEVGVGGFGVGDDLAGSTGTIASGRISIGDSVAEFLCPHRMALAYRYLIVIFLV